MKSFSCLSSVNFLVVILAYSTLVCGQTTVSSEVNADMILRAFCKLENKVDVMKCVDEKTNGEALKPWDLCMNSQKKLAKEDLINLSCKSLEPKYRMINGILTGCADALFHPGDGAKWMPVMESCSQAEGSSSNTEGTTTSSTKQ